MADNEDDDTFFEDDFPDIEDAEFQKLEHDAIVLSQRQQAAIDPRRNTAHNLQNKGRIQRNQPHNGLPQRNIPRSEHQNSFDSAILDEDGIPLVVEQRPPEIPQKRAEKPIDETTLREKWRQNRFAQPVAAVAPQQTRPVALQAPHNHLNGPPNLHQNSHRGPELLAQGSHATSEGALRSRIAELTRERDNLTAGLNEARNELYARRGEVSNLRSKHDNTQKMHERALETLRKTKQDELEKFQLRLKEIAAEKVQLTTQLEFSRQELAEESRRAQTYQQQLKGRPLQDQTTNVNTTPKKNTKSLRDGFDEDEIMVLSPAKSGRRSNKGTPTANRKRKQPSGNESWIQPLPLRLSGTNPDDEANQESVMSKPVSGVVAVTARKDHTTQRHLQLIQKVLKFRPEAGHETLVERLVKIAFPTAPSRPLSSIVLSATAELAGKRLPGDLLQIFIDLWSRALREKHYTCLGLLNDTISYILELDMFVVDSQIVENILPLLQSTVEINAFARFYLTKREWLDDPEKKKPEINPQINGTACLHLLHTIACLVSDNAILIERFWRLIKTDFVLMMLNSCQPIQDITIALQLLGTSVLPTTFGNICPPEQQTTMEGYIIDRICYLLWEIARPINSDEDVVNNSVIDSRFRSKSSVQATTHKPSQAYPRAAICHLRLEALQFLVQLSMHASPNPHDPTLANNHGTQFLVRHGTAIARLVRSIYDEVAAMYLVTPTQHLHAQLVNTGISLLHFLLKSPASVSTIFNAPLPTVTNNNQGTRTTTTTLAPATNRLLHKLAGVNGGAHKYRVVLTRLAFSEGIFIDKGITEETVRKATELLEDSVTPDEANDLTEAFGGVTTATGFGGTQPQQQQQQIQNGDEMEE